MPTSLSETLFDCIVLGAGISGVRAADDILHYLTVVGGDAGRFDAYYRQRYLL